MTMLLKPTASLLIAIVTASFAFADDPAPTTNARRPKNDQELRSWLENMVWHHRFTVDEIKAATGMPPEEIAAALERFKINAATRPKRNDDDPLLVLPYPGGRHPRVGFLDGAVNPQRETKLSVFTPWDDAHYVVLDVPEAIWWKEGDARELLYLAHTHVPTVWTKQGITLESTEWKRDDDALVMSRTLPNKVRLRTKAIARGDSVLMEMSLTNGTDETLTGLRVQACVMFKGAPPFAQQDNDNKLLRPPYAACRAAGSERWVITAWTPNQRTWANPPCPCMHSDPQFPDCPPGETVSVRGWLSFYEGDQIEGELRRIEATEWHAAEIN